MKAANQNKLEYWQNHYELSIRNPEGIESYCRANKLALSSYYNWRQIILNTKSSKNISKKVKSPFLPVVVSPEEFKGQSYPQLIKNQRLPDSRWVAEIITQVIRGLQL